MSANQNEFLTDDIASIIGLILNIAHEKTLTREDRERITLVRDSARFSNWGIMHRLRSNPPRRMHG